MAVFQNPDEIFESKLPGRDWLGANHARICHLDRDPWAPSDWQKGNCAYTPLNHPDDVAAEIAAEDRPTHRPLNGSMFPFYPTEDLWNRMLRFLDASDQLKTYRFPDQDLLADSFHDKWYPLSWKYNALKTMWYWHPPVWSDEKLVILHYIVDKPWERQSGPGGIAGQVGRDGETHQWWWDIYPGWRKQRGADRTSNALLDTMDKLNTHEPYMEKIPLPQQIGRPEDIPPYP